MAKISCSVTFRGFKADRAGYRTLMESVRVQALVRQAADGVCGRANALLSPDGYRLVGFECKPFQGRLAPGVVVRTKSDHARYSQARHKTLQKAMRGGRG